MKFDGLKKIRAFRWGAALAVVLGVASVGANWDDSAVWGATPKEKADAVAAMTKGVGAIPRRGAPGPVATLGDAAFPVVVGAYDSGTFEPLVSAAFVEKGRVVAFGHTEYVAAPAITATTDSSRFFTNVLRWAAGADDSTDAKSIRVAVWRDRTATEIIKVAGFDAVSVDEVPTDFDVFVAESARLGDAEYAKILARVDEGAGFVTCGLGWGWSQLNPGKKLTTDHPGNRNFAKFGVPLAWTDGFIDPTRGGEYATGEIARFVDGAETLAALEKSADGISGKEASQLAATATLIYRFLNKDDRAALDRLGESGSGEIVPTEKKPLRASDLVGRLAVAIRTDRYMRGQLDGETAPEDVPAFAAANDFPGAVPAKAEAPRLQNVEVSFKSVVPDWVSTGLYAAPGETISVEIDAELLRKLSKPLKVRIGAHSDRLWKLADWKRWPEITIEKTINGTETKVANPFGGPIYVVVPRGLAAAGLGRIGVKISGGVAAPLFVRDETSLDDWKTIRQNPAPWAEIQGRNVVLTVPSSVVRDLDDPQRLTEIWDRVLDLEAEFAGVPTVRERPERICCDRQISAGYMHSGYPVMTWLDVERDLVDAEKLATKGNWGFFHEFGHNHQSSHWTFDGSTEVTVNYFSLYIMEKLCGFAPGETRGELTKEARLKALKKYFADGSKFENWKSNPFLALNMTVQLRDAFGWEPFKRAVAGYRTAAPNELPKNDDEKRDQWLVRLSRETGRNLGPFFEKWGVPTSEAARKSVEDLPIWLPEEFDELN